MYDEWRNTCKYLMKIKLFLILVLTHFRQYFNLGKLEWQQFECIFFSETPVSVRIVGKPIHWIQWCLCTSSVSHVKCDWNNSCWYERLNVGFPSHIVPPSTIRNIIALRFWVGVLISLEDNLPTIPDFEFPDADCLPFNVGHVLNKHKHILVTYRAYIRIHNKCCGDSVRSKIFVFITPPS